MKSLFHSLRLKINLVHTNLRINLIEHHKASLQVTTGYLCKKWSVAFAHILSHVVVHNDDDDDWICSCEQLVTQTNKQFPK